MVDVLHDHRPARGQARGHAPQDLGDVGQVDEQEPRIDDVVALPLQGAHVPLPEADVAGGHMVRLLPRGAGRALRLGTVGGADTGQLQACYTPRLALIGHWAAIGVRPDRQGLE